jgi:histidine ammonia-lyase
MILLPVDNLDLTTVRRAALGEPVRLSGRGHKLVGNAHAKIRRILKLGKPVYGVNTGFGALADKAIPEDRLCELQENLVRSHAAGSGKPIARSTVRAAMFLRANMLSKGYSGVRCRLVEQLVAMLNKDVVPVVPESGSVGASGDLAPLAHIALVAIGRGEACFKGRRMSGRAALKAADLDPYELQPKEGLSLVNGTEVMAAGASLTVLSAERMADLADLTGAMTCAALGANPRVFEPDLHRLKAHPGQLASAANLRRYLAGRRRPNSRVQDAYSLRCIPQVHGAAREGIAFARTIVETEVNSVTDNPVLLDQTAVSGGNFHGSALALALDTLAIALTQLAAISERRIFRLLDGRLSGLPEFLVQDPGINSGLMIAQMLAASLVTDCKLLASPASVHSLPTSANQEDYVSMGMNSATKAAAIADKLETILTIELLCATQGNELADEPLPANLRPAFRLTRRTVPFIASDRELHIDIERLKATMHKML